MDPVTTFTLTAGVLQVIDLSSRVLSKCQEFYKDGSLAEHKASEEITKCLGKQSKNYVDAVERLKAPVHQAHNLGGQMEEDLVDISTKCSETAAELVVELEKLKLDSQGGLRDALKKSVRSIRKKDFLEEIQRRLDAYQRILDTRILLRLDGHSIEQMKEFPSLDQRLRDLVRAVNQGHNTVRQLLTEQGQALRHHIDRRLDHQAQAEQKLRVHQQFKNSLFFPEILARQEQIPEAYRGTCRWIFDPPKDNKLDLLMKKMLQIPSWPKFPEWLKHGEGVYWINGKAGSGKSTLMNYITNEPQTGEALTTWANGSEILRPSFFFWNPGTVLQKTYQGLLRSLLFQIADQRPDLISILMGQEPGLVETRNGSSESVQIYAWTERRLLNILRHFLISKPSSIRICFFIDGLDEFIGDQDILIELIQLMTSSPWTKVCVSSRPEHFFRHEFQDSQQLRLQDFNCKDLKETAENKLRPVLKKYFPCEERKIDNLISEVAARCQGIFLWLDIVIKNIINGARNSDNLNELKLRLEIMPDTLEGLYEHMLSRLDKLYLSEAIRYFHLLMISGDSGLSLLDFACAESLPWEHVMGNDLSYFESIEFHNRCNNLEIRILTRCAGLVDISEYSAQWLSATWKGSHLVGSRGLSGCVRASEEGQNISRQLRQVTLTHRSVKDFLETHRQVFFQEPDWRSAATLALARGRLGSMSIIPIAKSKLDMYQSRWPGWVCIGSSIVNVMQMVSAIEDFGDNDDQTFMNAAIEMVDHTYQIINQVDLTLNGPNIGWYNRYFGRNLHSWCHRVPFHDCPGFAGFFGCRSYILRHLSVHSCLPEELNYLLACTITGLKRHPLEDAQLHRYFTIIGELLHQGADPNLSLYLELGRPYNDIYDVSAWSTFLGATVPMIRFVKCLLPEKRPRVQDQCSGQVKPFLPLWITLIEFFLARGADVNISLFSDLPRYCPSLTIQTFELQESALSFIERWMLSEVHPNMKQLRTLITSLKSRGAVHRRACRRIFYQQSEDGESYDLCVPPSCYELSQHESDRLLESWSNDVKTLGHAAEEMTITLPEPTILDELSRTLMQCYKAEDPSNVKYDDCR